jgi:hypothetical protein
MNTFPARIGHLTQGQIRSIALHEANEDTGELLARFLTDPERVAIVIGRGDASRLYWHGHDLVIAHQPAGNRPITHPDNHWPPGPQCLYLHQQDTWWKRTANTDGTWPDTWTPITQQERA